MVCLPTVGVDSSPKDICATVLARSQPWPEPVQERPRPCVQRLTSLLRMPLPQPVGGQPGKSCPPAPCNMQRCTSRIHQVSVPERNASVTRCEYSGRQHTFAGGGVHATDGVLLTSRIWGGAVEEHHHQWPRNYQNAPWTVGGGGERAELSRVLLDPDTKLSLCQREASVHPRTVWQLGRHVHPSS